MIRAIPLPSGGAPEASSLVKTVEGETRFVDCGCNASGAAGGPAVIGLLGLVGRGCRRRYRRGARSQRAWPRQRVVTSVPGDDRRPARGWPGDAFDGPGLSHPYVLPVDDGFHVGWQSLVSASPLAVYTFHSALVDGGGQLVPGSEIDHGTERVRLVSAPLGRRLYSRGEVGKTYELRLATGELVGAPLQHSELGNFVAFDGDAFLFFKEGSARRVGLDGTIGAPFRIPEPLESSSLSAADAADGTGYARGTVSSSELPPAGLTWAEYIERWVNDCGGWLPLADQLIHRARESVEIPEDPQTVERGLRRLARRDHKPGGQYGRWMLRFFGVTSPVEQWVRWLGTYHSRFADLPSGLRLEQLALWNRPPVSESPLACWIHVGIASAHRSRLDLDACELWLSRADRHAAAAGAAAEIEIALLRAELATSRGEHVAAEAHEEAVEARLATAGLPEADELPYRARLATARAERFTRPPAGVAPDFERARACFVAIPETAIPFVAFRKHVGLAYCAWKLGDLAEATRRAERAVDEAGDGGFVRMRVMALNMLSRILTGPSAVAVNERARRMATALEDEDLLRRVGSCAPGAAP